MNEHSMHTSNRLDPEYPLRAWERDRALITPVSDLLDARQRAPCQEREQGFSVEGRTILQAQGESTITRTHRLCTTPQRRWSAAERLLHTVIKSTNAGKARRKRDIGQRKMRLLDEQARRLSASAASQSKRAGPNLCHQFAVQVPLADRQTLRQSGDALGIYDAFGDQAQGARHQISPHIPVRRIGAGLGMTAAAGAKSSSLRRRCAGIEAHIARLRGWRWTDGPAIDTGRSDRRKEPAIETRVAAADGAVTQVKIGVDVCCLFHTCIIHDTMLAGWRFSDITMSTSLMVMSENRQTILTT